MPPLSGDEHVPVAGLPCPQPTAFPCPQGYPHTVAPRYLCNTLWAAAHHTCGSVNGGAWHHRRLQAALRV